jgi:hypothetical protein
MALDVRSIHPEAVEIGKNELPEDVTANPTCYADATADFCKLSGKYNRRSAGIKNVIVDELFNLAELGSHVAGQHQINAHVCHAKHIERFAHH